jgi:beta-glucosidase
MLQFPKGFVWGAATAAYQIEGAVHEDGRGESIWDRFCRTPGKVFGGETGDVACDHYHLWRDDVALMKRLRLGGYRFSVAWPRIFPQGSGKPNPAGLDFYSRLVDGLLAAGVAPALTLYHWDLPQALQDRGGWENRDTAERFVEYAATVLGALGDRVRLWITLNEPFVVAFSANFEGRHAPGKTDFATAVRVAHTQMVAHARTVGLFRRDFSRSGQIGITLNMRPCYAQSPADEEAARRADGYLNRWFLDPVFRGWYPADMLEHYRAKGVAAGVDESDRALLASAKVDFLGVNFYTRALVHRSDAQPLEFGRETPAGAPVTETGWEIYPRGLYDLLTRVDRDYGKPEMYITEGGAAFKDSVVTAGLVDDGDRLDYLRRHLAQAHRAIADGVGLKGYFVWTLMDNFEWEHGTSKLFGIAKTDYSTQVRTPKRSGLWYQQVAEANAIDEA